MANIDSLQKKIEELEERLKKVEEKITSPENAKENAFMEALCQKAKDLVIREQKAAPFFLQRKLLIDYERAAKLLDMLEAKGIVGPETGGGHREVLVKK